MADTRPNKVDYGDDALGVRIPPHSLEAEQAVIGGLLIDPNAFDKVVLESHEFYQKRNRDLFDAICELNRRGEPCDFITVSNCLKNSKKHGEDILAYLATLAKETPSAAHIAAYAGIVREHAARRRLISAATEIIENAHNTSGIDSQALLNQAEQSILEVSGDNKKSSDFRALPELSSFVCEKIDQRSKSDETLTGVATGFTELDEGTSGLQKGDLIVIAGRPSMGKTSLALNIVEHVAFKQQRGTVAIFSLEMPGEQIVFRLFSSLGSINQMRLRTGKLSQEEWTSLTKWHSAFQKASLFIDDSSTLTPEEVCSKVRRLKHECPDLALVVVDYLQLMNSSRNVENRAVEISGISRALKALAKEVEVPVVALSQLNRNIEHRSEKEKKPQMSDLRESGAIEQDADLIMAIYRNQERGDAQVNDVIRVDVVKQRNGPTFGTNLTFIGKYTRFENYIGEEAVGTHNASQKVVTSFDDLD